MKARLAAVLFCMAVVIDASACAGCYWERLMYNHWPERFLICNCFLPIVFTVTRIDPVRILYVFVPYLFFAYVLHGVVLFGTYSLPELVAIPFWVAWGSNLIGVGLLFFLSRFAFFRRNKAVPISKWMPWAYAGLSLIVNIAIH